MKILTLFNSIRLIISLLGVIAMMTSCTTIGQLANASEKNKHQGQALARHNKFRVRHHAPNLVWDNTLADYAERHAQHCQFKHSSSPYGENLAAGYMSMTAAINAWYAEHIAYSYAHPGFSMATGHFTQLVWKSTKKLGCGYAQCHDKRGTPWKFWVCEYSPAGNILGKFKANVLPESHQ